MLCDLPIRAITTTVITMPNEYYPRIETISVPDHVPAVNIGKVVSAEVVKILDGVGKSSINLRSIYLRPVSERLYVLGYDTNQPYSLPKDLDLGTPNTTEPGTVEQTRVAVRNRNRLS